LTVKLWSAGTGIMHGVRQAAPSEVLASAPGGSDSIVSETFAPLVRLLGMKFQLGVQELQPAASRALATAHTRTKGLIALASPARPRAARTIGAGRRPCNQKPAPSGSMWHQQTASKLCILTVYRQYGNRPSA